ncbi:MAG TPA: CrcB family protein [Nocardioidaceae bacterium]|nr:CrcB family protein [Nocardioidaceae bacterium]
MNPRVVGVVALGGALGAALRYALGEAFPIGTEGFPWTTFGINVSGALLLALLPAVAVVRRHELLPPLLGTGVLGGFTTMSAFAEQVRELAHDGHATTAAAYLVATLVSGIVAVAVADLFSSRAARAEFDVEEGDL